MLRQLLRQSCFMIDVSAVGVLEMLQYISSHHEYKHVCIPANLRRPKKVIFLD